MFCGFLLLLSVHRHQVAEEDPEPRTFCLIGVHRVWRVFLLDALLEITSIFQWLTVEKTLMQCFCL